MDYLPITVQLKDRLCLIVGGGEVAARKLKHLLKAQSRVTLVSREISEQVQEIADGQPVTLIEGEFDEAHLHQVYLVIAATDDRLVNRQVSVAAQRQNIWVNVVDDLELSTFIMPAVIDRSPLLIAVSSAGVSPVLVRKIREQIEWLLPTHLPRLLKKLSDLRESAKRRWTSLTDKRLFSEWFIDKALVDPELLEQSTPQLFESFERKVSREGKVFLVGAGPGDPELLTVKALKLLQTADVVLYDALVSQPILDQVRKDARLEFVGKRAKGHAVDQMTTNQLLVSYAKQGLRVVRLKGGDPFIFGRGGEELQVLAENRLKFEVVPGITAASGCTSYAGIPLTHRDFAQSVQFVTAHERDDSHAKVDWSQLAAAHQTLVFYMGLAKVGLISQRLIQAGRHANTPVALIEKGCTPAQRVVKGELHQLAELVDLFKVSAPALVVVGEVVALADQLDWYQAGQVIDTRQMPKIVNL